MKARNGRLTVVHRKPSTRPFSGGIVCARKNGKLTARQSLSTPRKDRSARMLETLIVRPGQSVPRRRAFRMQHVQ